MGYNVWDCRLNGDTHNYGGLEWIVDGERDRWSYPGTMPECMVKRLYAEGLSEVPCIGYCDGCTGMDDRNYCRKIRRS